MTTQVRADELVKLLRPEFGNASGGSGITPAALEGPGIDVVGWKIGLGGDTVLLYHVNGNPVEEYAATEAGLIAALGAANSGDTVDCQSIPIALTAGFTLPAGVTLVNAVLSFSNFAGIGVTLSNGSILRDFDVTYDGAGQANATGISATSIDTAALYHGDCVVQDAAGTNIAVDLDGTSVTEYIHTTLVYGNAKNGTVAVGIRIYDNVKAKNSLGYASGASAANVGILVMAGLIADPGFVFSCVGTATGTGSAGISVGTGAYFATLSHCWAAGATYGLYIGVGATAKVADLYWSGLTNNGTITYLQGSRSNYSVEDYHATDIEAAALTRHLPAPVGRGDLAVVNAAANWSIKALGGAVGSVLTRDANDPTWSGYYLSGTAGQTYTFGTTGGTIPTAAGTLSVSSANNITAAGVITHAITTSSNPGAAASILASDASGYLRLVSLGIGATPTGAGEIVGPGGMYVYGGLAANDDLYLEGTKHATRATSYVYIQSGGGKTLIGPDMPPALLLLTMGWNQNAATDMRIYNSHAGVSALCEVQLYNGTGAGDFVISGTGFNDGSNFVANEVGLIAESTAAGLHLRANANTYIRISVGVVPIEIARFTAGGFFIGAGIAPWAYLGIDGSGFFMEQIGTNAANDSLRFQVSASGAGVDYTQVIVDPATGVSIAKLGAGVANLAVAGDLTISGGDIITTTATTNLLNTVATTINFGGACTILNFGAASCVINGAGGLTINGGIAANDDITIQGTSHATRTTSYVLLQPNGGKVGAGTTPEVTLDVAGVMRSLANDAGWPASGTGLELSYDAGDATAYVGSYDRTGSAYKPLYLYASAMTLATGDTVPGGNKTQDFGAALFAWDDMYADDYNNVADIPFLDDRDDLQTICSIRPSSVLDSHTGFRLIDDGSLPDWMIVKDKYTGQAVHGQDGKPYVSLKTMVGLAFGAIRQLAMERKGIK